MLVRVEGRLTSVKGMSLRAMVPGARIGDVVQITRASQGDYKPTLLAEVVGFDSDEMILIPLESLEGLSPNDVVEPLDKGFTIRCGPSLLGRVLGGLGEPIDGLGPINEPEWSVSRTPPPPLSRPRIKTQLVTQVRTIDALMPIGHGQRLGIFAGSGVGKSTLMGQLARQSQADVFVVALIGERGRELVEFLEDSLGKDGRARGVVVCATSDAPAMVRMKSAWVATAIAEYFRDQGKNVLLMMDSVTRFARASREVGLAAGEAPTRRGYPPSTFALLPELLERTGTSAKGSITGLYTVLVEGGDLDEPIADEVRGILDGHIVLDRQLANRGRFPAIDPVISLSRLMPQIADPTQRQAASVVRSALAHYEAKRDLVALGAYKPGADPQLDKVLASMSQVESFLAQLGTDRSAMVSTLEQLAALAARLG